MTTNQSISYKEKLGYSMFAAVQGWFYSTTLFIFKWGFINLLKFAGLIILGTLLFLAIDYEIIERIDKKEELILTVILIISFAIASAIYYIFS